MHFGFASRLYRHPDDEISLRDVWNIGDGELNTAAELALAHLHDGGELAALHRGVAWLSQAVIEFADLLDYRPPRKGHWQHKNYLYFEAVSALREATVGTLNGLPRASTALLRAVLEMFLLHCQWQERMARKDSTIEFYDWLGGNGKKPHFRDVARNNVVSLEIPGGDDAVKRASDTYTRLCSYVHVPLLSESMTTLGHGNLSNVSTPILRHWLELARDTLRIALEHLVHHRPQCMFPVDIPTKFAFSPPVGMFFDAFNFVPLQAAFGERRIDDHRARFKDHEFVKSAMDYYDSQPDLATEQILGRWDDQDTDGFGDDVERSRYAELAA